MKKSGIKFTDTDEESDDMEREVRRVMSMTHQHKVEETTGKLKEVN